LRHQKPRAASQTEKMTIRSDQVRNFLSELSHTLVEFFKDTFKVGIMNPAVLCCVYLILFKDWSQSCRITLFAIWLLSFANLQCNFAIGYLSYRNNARKALSSIERCKAGYNITVTDLEDHFPSEVLGKLGILPWSISVWQLTPKKGFKPYLR